MNKLKLARFLLMLAKAAPRRYPARSAQPPSPFFILNAGRSGSTLLNRILNEHPQLGLPSEQYFLGPAIFKYHFYNYMLWRDLMQVVVGELWDERKHTWQLEMKSVLEQVVGLQGRARTLDQMVELLFRQVVDQEHWGDSTPLNVYYYRELWHLFPQAKYIFLVRDGRDVVASYNAGGPQAFAELADPAQACDRWLLSMEAHQWMQQRAQVLTLRYEEMVTNTQPVLDQITDFLGVDQLSDWQHYPEQVPATTFYKPAHHDAIRQMPFAHSIGQWPTRLTTEEQAMCQRCMGKHLKSQGYI